MIKKITLITAILMFFQIDAQTSPTIEWQKTLGGSDFDYAYSVQQTSDSGYIIAGWSYSNDGDITGHHGAVDYWVAKLDSEGSLQWQNSLGGSGYDYATSVQQTSDSGYVVAGFSTSNDGDVTANYWVENSWVVKLDSEGSIQWQKTFGGNSDDGGNSIQQTSDGGFIIAGYSSSNDGDVTGNHGGDDFWVVKLDNDGSLQWQKSLGGNNQDNAYSVQQTSDGGYIVAGCSKSNNGDVTGHHGNDDYWVVKLDSSGAIQWEKSLGGSNNDWGYSVQQTSDDGYIIAGTSNSNDGNVTGNHGDYDYWVVKLNSSGLIQWQKSLGGSGEDSAYSVQQALDGGYIIVGILGSNDGDVIGSHGSGDYWMLKLDNSGTIQWQKTLGGSGGEGAYSVQQTSDGGYVLAGTTTSNDGDVTGFQGQSDYWIVKLTAEEMIIQENQLVKLIVYPNPVKDSLQFSEEVSIITITDISGKIVKQSSDLTKSIKLSDLSGGVYFVSAVTNSGKTFHQKIVKE